MPVDLEECTYYVDCARCLAETLHEALHGGNNEPEGYADAAYGLVLLLDYIMLDMKAVAAANRRTPA